MKSFLLFLPAVIAAGFALSSCATPRAGTFTPGADKGFREAYPKEYMAGYEVGRRDGRLGGKMKTDWNFHSNTKPHEYAYWKGYVDGYYRH